MSKIIVAVDFDGTLCENKYPEAGSPNEPLINALKNLRSEGKIDLILWTCRCDDQLEYAVRWCEKQGLEFDAINENLPRIIELYKGDTRKVSADIYIDDLCESFGYEKIYNASSLYDPFTFKRYFIKYEQNWIQNMIESCECHHE